MTPKNASSEARRHLRLLAGELGVSVRGISDDDLNIVAIRFVLDGRITTDALQAIVDDVRDGSGQAKDVKTNSTGPLVPSEEPALPPAPSSRKMHYLATEATAAKMRHRLRLAHQAEDSRAALYVVPRTPEVLPVDKPHPACLVSAREEHGTVCQRCSWLLQDDPYTDFWIDRDDSTGGRL
jgi:hypothetical protein